MNVCTFLYSADSSRLIFGPQVMSIVDPWVKGTMWLTSNIRLNMSHLVASVAEWKVRNSCNPNAHDQLLIHCGTSTKHVDQVNLLAVLEKCLKINNS